MMSHKSIPLKKHIGSIRPLTRLIWAMIIMFQLIGLSPAYAQYQVDSVVHILEDRVIKTSQQIGHASNTLLRTYTSTDKQNNIQFERLRYFSQFDSDDQLILNIASQWNTLMKDWEEVEKREIKFDENGRTILMRESRRDDKEGWEQASIDSVIYYKDSIETFSYMGSEVATKNVGYQDQEENEYLSINYRWNLKLGRWDPWIKTDFEHRKNGAIEESSTYLWKAGKWVPNEKTTYVFAGNTEKSTGSISYSGNEHGWQPEFKIARDYKEDQRIETDTTYHWSADEKRWNPEVVVRVSSYLKERSEQIQEQLTFKINTERNIQELLFEAKSTYNDQDQLIFYQGISYEDGAPISGDQQKYLIDAHGNIEKYTFLELDTNAFEWVPVMETDYTYHPDFLWSINGENTIKSIHSLDTYPFSDRNKNLISEVKEYLFENGHKKLHEQVLYYYSLVKEEL